MSHRRNTCRIQPVQSQQFSGSQPTKMITKHHPPALTVSLLTLATCMRAVAVSIDWLESSSTGISYTIYQLHVFYGRMSLRAAYSQEGMCCASKKIHTTVCYTDTTHAQRCSLLKAQRKTCLESVSVILGSNNIVYPQFTLFHHDIISPMRQFFVMWKYWIETDSHPSLF